jgi:uncharacterized membrane protein
VTEHLRGPLAALFVAAGVGHFVRPRFYLGIMPPWIPKPRFWVGFTGVCEIAGGAGLLIEPLRAAAGWGLIALLACVFPANVHMLRQEWSRGVGWRTLALAARLPLQLLLLRWVYTAADLGG